MKVHDLFKLLDSRFFSKTTINEKEKEQENIDKDKQEDIDMMNKEKEKRQFRSQARI